jgi:hypothetical protein
MAERDDPAIGTREEARLVISNLERIITEQGPAKYRGLVPLQPFSLALGLIVYMVFSSKTKNTEWVRRSVVIFTHSRTGTQLTTPTWCKI